MGKYEMSLVQSLTDFTNENTGLMAKAIYGAKTIAGGIEVLPGQKHDVKLNTLDHSLYLQAAACGWTVSGTTNLGQVTVDVCSVDYKEALCPKTLEPKWYGQIMRQGSNPEELPFAQYIIDTKVKELSAQVEYMLWQANNATGTGNLALCKGLIQNLSGTTVVTCYTTGITSATIMATVEAVIASLDERVALEDDLALYMSVAVYKTYTAALRTANLFHYDGADGANMECTIPGTNITAIATPGLRGHNYVYLTPKSNIVFVTDLLSDTEELDMWYSRDNNEIRILGGFKMGVNVYFPEFVVTTNPGI